LILDNFEQVLEAAPLVADLLTSVASLRVLVTSRAPLRVRSEREYAIGPLELEAGSETMPPADLARTPAVRLFVERVRDIQPDFRLTSANGSTVTAICRRLDALPLALELAAPWLKVLTVDNLLHRLTHDVLLSTVGPRDLPERQQTMNATVAWSYHLLDPDEQRAFRHFGALPGPFPIDAAAAVLAGREGAPGWYDEALRATASLMDKSLLLRAETSVVATCPLYYMLDTVRAFAARELTASGARDDAMEGLMRYSTGESALAAEGLVGPAQVEWLDRVREDLESYRGALAWLIERGRPAEASDIACGLMFFWMIRGHAAEGLRWSGFSCWRCMFGPSGRCGGEATMRRSRWCVKASHVSGNCMTSSRSCTCWSLLPPRRHSRAQTRGRRGFWALGTRSPNAQAPRLSTSPWTICENRPNESRALASAPIGGPGRMLQGVTPLSMLSDIDSPRG
jgi:predicted ATPase